ncbi:MAG: DNA polymerase III subunit gamma/tau [Bacilli bacterium]|nr:DNA polymerase III subunit gamma/tau [Bacilli bacterium]
MSYKTLYRMYRPNTFAEVFGQHHITKTFQNALKNDKISHAYLFTGPRGTGKTSVAKIIAKAVNCEKAPTDEPCNECPSCLSINSGFDNDIYEIDAASNNGVDEIREIRDKVKYAPTVGRYKVYIIDEVHMLSTGAFNALLKTLEEPPAHVIFILATTEPHKIPATIISRCQRFDFKSISTKDIIERIKFIVKEENIQIEEKAIVTIAKNAHGGMRDALSLLDQAISYSDGIVTEKNVHEITGTISEEMLVDLAQELLNGNTQNVIEKIDKFIAMGKEPLRILEDMIFYFRDVFLLKKIEQTDGELITNNSEETKKLSETFTETELMEIIRILNNAQYEMRKSNLPRVFIELAVFEISNYFKKPQPKDQRVVLEQDTIESKVEEVVEIKPTPAVDMEKKYIDVAIIEDVLYNASKEKKLTIVMGWQSIKAIDLNLVNVEQILLDGTVEAVSTDNKIILSYEYDTICASLYDKDTYDKAVKLLEQTFHERYEIVALPKRLWQEKREEYVNQLRNKIRRPKLSPITEPIIVKRQTDKYEFEPEFVKEAIQLFGEDIVKIK